MTQQTVNIGSAANAGDGDPLRDAFDKVNDNFNELYDAKDNGLEVIVSSKIPAPTTALTATNGGLEAGGLEAGDYYYKVTYVTAEGETELGPASAVVTASGHPTQNKIFLTNIPISPDPEVIARRIYRTKVNQAVGSVYWTTNAFIQLSDNTTTEYTDKTADTFMLRPQQLNNYTGGKIKLLDTQVVFFGENNLFVGYASGASIQYGTYNLFLGAYAGNAAIGSVSGNYQGNTFVGYFAGYNTTYGETNTAVGINSLWSNTTGSQNTAIGVSAGDDNTTGKHNVFVGVHAGFKQVLSDGCIFIGPYCGDASTLAGESDMSDLDNVICIGYGNKATAEGQCVIGSSYSLGRILDFYLGQGVEASSPEGISVHATDASNNDTSGGNHTIESGAGRGNGAGSSIVFKTPSPEASGSTKQTNSERGKINENGLSISRNDASVVAPGSDKLVLRVEAGTNAGTLKIVAYAGTSTTGVTIADNIGAGSS